MSLITMRCLLSTKKQRTVYLILYARPTTNPWYSSVCPGVNRMRVEGVIGAGKRMRNPHWAYNTPAGSATAPP